MQSGKLDRRVTIQTPTTVKGELGGVSINWTHLTNVWANVRDLTGRETFAAQAAGSHVSKVVTIRHRTGFDATARIVLDDGSIGKIAWISEVGRKQGLQVFIEVQQ